MAEKKIWVCKDCLEMHKENCVFASEDLYGDADLADVIRDNARTVGD